jgi:hypothetical protein
MINLNDLVKENQLNTDITELTEQQTNCIVGGGVYHPHYLNEQRPHIINSIFPGKRPLRIPGSIAK